MIICDTGADRYIPLAGLRHSPEALGAALCAEDHYDKGLSCPGPGRRAAGTRTAGTRTVGTRAACEKPCATGLVSRGRNRLSRGRNRPSGNARNC